MNDPAPPPSRATCHRASTTRVEAPRQKLLRLGAAPLSDTELLSVLLAQGPTQPDPLLLAQDILRQARSFAPLINASAPPHRAYEGLRPHRRAELLAMSEIIKRALQQSLSGYPVFDQPSSVKHYAQLQLQGLPQEVFAVMFLDAQHRLLRWEDMFKGTLSQTSVYPREIARRALELHAAALILVHNHPSGLAEPSRADEHLTQHLKASLALIDVRVLDHLVVGQGEVVSFAERGLL